jgi:hypothetical protein
MEVIIMFRIKSQTNPFALWILWVISIFGGWIIYIYPGLNFQSGHISSWSELFSLSGSLFLQSLLFGSFIGFAQYILLRFRVDVSAWWIALSGVSYALGAILGLLLSSISTWMIQPEIFSTRGQTILLFPLAFVMLIGGGITGIIQAYAFKGSVTQNKTKILFWVLASSLGWGVGYFVASFSWGINLPFRFQSGLAGLVIGFITGIAFIFLQQDVSEKMPVEHSLA